MNAKWIEWDEEKNRRLKKERNLSFEDVENAIEQGDVLDDVPHPDKAKYPLQRVLIVRIDGYVCLVPYVAQGETRFLKTIYRSRKANRLFSKETEDE